MHALDWIIWQSQILRIWRGLVRESVLFATTAFGRGLENVTSLRSVHSQDQPSCKDLYANSDKWLQDWPWSGLCKNLLHLCDAEVTDKHPNHLRAPVQKMLSTSFNLILQNQYQITFLQIYVLQNSVEGTNFVKICYWINLFMEICPIEGWQKLAGFQKRNSFVERVFAKFATKNFVFARIIKISIKT